jgi:transketolase
MSTKNLGDKWKSFGWDVSEIDGHNIEKILHSLNLTSDKPRLILAKTIKGKGFSFAENNNDWHHKILTQKQYDEAEKELNET